MAKVIVTDWTFSDLEIEQTILGAEGAEVLGAQGKTVEALLPLVQGVDAVITQFAPIKAQVIDAMDRARVIVRYGIGVDNVDLEAARVRGIPVCNVPDYCIDEVADHTLAFLLALTRQVVPNCLHVRQGQWGLATGLENLSALRNLSIGIVGFGRIGREVAARLAPFGCHRMVFDPQVSEDLIRSSGCEPVGWPELLQRSDVLTLHCPSTPQTRKMLDGRAFESMKDRALLVNLARGDLVDTGALVQALESGKLAGAALDVCDPEPIPAENPLRRLPNVISASHIASASPRAVRKLRETAARIALAALRGESLPNIVNGVN